MYCYKLNNSYITYVNYYYINQCRKASQKVRKERQTKTAEFYNRTPVVSFDRKVQSKETVAALPKNTVVNHKSFGKGIIIETSSKGYVVVNFNERNVKFQYPQSFDLGYLSCVTR